MQRKFARSTLVLILVTASCAFGATASWAERFTERLERSFSVASDVEVELANTNGAVSIVAWGRSEVDLVAEKTVDARSRADADEVFEKIEVQIRDSAGRIEIETRTPSFGSGFFDWIFGRARGAAVRYELRVPHSAVLDLHSVNGSLTTVGITGEQRLKTTNGRIRVREAGAAVAATTTNGGLDVDVVGEPADLDVELSTTNGGITLGLDGTVGARLVARTVNGRVQVDLPVTTDGGSSRRRLSGDINGGGPGRIGLRTTNGSIRIRESG